MRAFYAFVPLIVVSTYLSAQILRPAPEDQTLAREVFRQLENALPQTAEANVNCRILPGHSAREVREELVKIVGDPGVNVEFGYMKGKTPSHDPDDKALPPPPLDPVVFGALHRTTEQFWKGIEILPRMGTGCDGLYLHHDLHHGCGHSQLRHLRLSD